MYFLKLLLPFRRIARREDQKVFGRGGEMLQLRGSPRFAALPCTFMSSLAAQYPSG